MINDTHAEFKRNFRPLEVFGIGFTLIGLVPSISYVPYRFRPTTGKVDEIQMRKAPPSYSRYHMEVHRP